MAASTLSVSETSFQEVIKSIDKDAPLSVELLVKLFSVQSNFLLSEFNKKLAQQEKIISTQAESIQSLQSENEILRRDLNDVQQYTRRNSIRINGIPAPEDRSRESVQQLETKVKALFKDKMKVNLAGTDFCRIHRTGKPKQGAPRQVLVKFTNYYAKRCVIKARKLCKDFNGPHPIYVNEDLTRQRAKLAARAGAAKRSKQLKDTWTWDGKIFLKLFTDHVKVVSTQEELDNILSVFKTD